MTTTTHDTEQLRWQIEQQRTTLSRDLEALGDHMSPGRMVERRKAAMGQRVRRVKDTLMGTADTATSRAHDARASVTGTVSEAGSTVAGAVREAPDMVAQRTQGSPLGMGLISFGIGLVAGSLLPESRKERELAAKVEPALEQAATEAGHIAREGMDELKPVAEHAAASVKEDVQDATRKVQETAKEHAQSVRQEAQGAAQHVAGEAKGDGTSSSMPTQGPSSARW